MNILGINFNHNSSVALFNKNTLIYFNLEERLSRIKNDSDIPINCLNEIKKLNVKINKVLLTGYDTFGGDQISSYIKKIKLINNKVDVFSYCKSHHLIHAFKAFFNSGFKKSIVIVIDGRGSSYTLSNGENGYETTSVYKVENTDFKCLYKNIYTKSKNINNLKVLYEIDYPYKNKIIPISINGDTIFNISSKLDVGNLYSAITYHMGFFENQEGKLMGLQSYGKSTNELIKLIDSDDFIKEDSNININTEKYPFLKNNNDLAASVQKYLEKKCLDLFEKFKDKNIILTGGVALNILNNYELQKYANKKNINLFIEPVCGDEGNSIGICKYYINKNNFDYSTAPFKNVYYGPGYDYDLILNNNEKVIEPKLSYIADLLTKGELIAIYQNCAEAGHRALGNRSLLFNPAIKDAKNIVNTVKNREAFRPFGCSVLKEEADKWFDMAGLSESPYMMYAVKVFDKTLKEAASIVHVDGSSRIQTVSKDQNTVLYNILKLFYRQNKLPILLNTSLNLANEPIVEKPEEALNMLRNSKLKYLYFADINKLVYKNN
jgi:carbamoyltransferase